MDTTIAQPPTDGNTPPRTPWTEAVERVSAIAHAKLPESLHGRLERATALVLSGAVLVEEDGQTCQVRSSDGTHWYRPNGTCGCRDHATAPGGWCKHRLAVAISRRAGEVLHQPLTLDLDPEVLGTAPGQGIPAQYLTTVHGKPFVQFAGLLALAHARGLQRLEARLVSVTSELALAEATATFADGRVFTEAADATPSNVHVGIRAHFPRMALTRAKARALRDGLNIGICTLEELGQD